MNIAAVVAWPFSQQGWQRLKNNQPSITTIVWLLLVPMAFLPPLALYFAGTHFDNTYIQGFSDKNWRFITTVFFMAELLTFFVMGWLVYSVARARGLQMGYADAYLLAAIAPLPMWLSSLGMLVPVLLVNALALVAGFLASCLIVYQGILALSGRKPGDVVSMSAAYTVMSASFLAWGLLAVILWAF